jgi:hypothetical protein
MTKYDGSWVRDELPAFLDVDLEEFRDEEGNTVVQVSGQHRGETYSFEYVPNIDGSLPEELQRTELRRLLSEMINAVMRES